MLNNLFGIQELIRNLVSGTGCSGYSLLFLTGTIPSSATQIQKAANRCILQEAFSVDFHTFVLSNFSFNAGFVPHYGVTLPGGYLVNSLAGLRPIGHYLTLFTEKKSRATRLATKSKTDFKVYCLVVKHTHFKFMDMSGYLRKTRNQP